MLLTPEQVAREQIDRLLQAAGWLLQDKDDFNRNAALGVAVREFPLPGGPCDYMLIVAGKAAGVIEAKQAGTTLSSVADQSERYMAVLPAHLARWDDRLCFDYESTGDETNFRDMRDPRPRSRRVFAFHRPETPVCVAYSRRYIASPPSTHANAGTIDPARLPDRGHQRPGSLSGPRQANAR